MYYNSLDNVNFDEDVDTIPTSSNETHDAVMQQPPA